MSVTRGNYMYHPPQHKGFLHFTHALRFVFHSIFIIYRNGINREPLLWTRIVFSVRYELKSYVWFRLVSVSKGL